MPEFLACVQNWATWPIRSKGCDAVDSDLNEFGFELPVLVHFGWESNWLEAQMASNSANSGELSVLFSYTLFPGETLTTYYTV